VQLKGNLSSKSYSNSSATPYASFLQYKGNTAIKISINLTAIHLQPTANTFCYVSKRYHIKLYKIISSFSHISIWLLSFDSQGSRPKASNSSCYHSSACTPLPLQLLRRTHKPFQQFPVPQPCDLASRTKTKNLLATLVNLCQQEEKKEITF
jgi:hypothetical protein